MFASIEAKQVKKDHEIFDKWIKHQQVFSDRNLTDMSSALDSSYIGRVNTLWVSNYQHLHPLREQLGKVTDGLINAGGIEKTTIPESTKNSLKRFYSVLENNPAMLSELLNEYGFNSPQINDKEALLARTDNHYNDVIDKYATFMQLLFAHTDQFVEQEYQFAVANRLFEYCFYPETFDTYCNMAFDHTHHPFMRLLNSIVWKNLVGTGWRQWHKSTLDRLLKESKTGKKIVYIAGGNDIRALLEHGIYNMTIIDPFLPSQERYYTGDYEWFVKNSTNNDGIDDELHIEFANKKIKLVRKSFQESEQIYHLTLSTGKDFVFKGSTTVWTIYENNNLAGVCTFKRRLALPEDFVSDQKTAVLMSYDEACYAALSKMVGGWDIDPTDLDDNFVMHVKQLRKPIGKQVLQNLRFAELLNLFVLQFIRLATTPY